MQKVGWFCTYVPEELIHAAGFFPYRIFPYKIGGTKDKYFPPNFCPYVRNIVEVLEQDINSYRAIIVTNSCNAMVHLYNAIKENFNINIFLLNVPKKNDKIARSFFTEELKRLKHFLEELRGEEISPQNLIDSITNYQRTNHIIKNIWPDLCLSFPLAIASDFSNNIIDFFNHLYHENRENFNTSLENKPLDTTLELARKKQQKEFILLSGAIPSRSFLHLINEEISYPVLMENCLGNRHLVKDFNLLNEKTSTSSSDEMEILSLISSTYLSKPPCPKIFTTGEEKTNLYNSILNKFNIKGIIFHELNFCDYSNYDYLRLKKILGNNLPLLKINTELEEQESGQFKTRLNAFLEMIE